MIICLVIIVNINILTIKLLLIKLVSILFMPAIILLMIGGFPLLFNVMIEVLLLHPVLSFRYAIYNADIRHCFVLQM